MFMGAVASLILTMGTDVWIWAQMGGPIPFFSLGLLSSFPSLLRLFSSFGAIGLLARLSSVALGSPFQLLSSALNYPNGMANRTTSLLSRRRLKGSLGLR
jgi:hypothetical protein